MLTQDVQAYLAERRVMGFAMKWTGNLLRSFAAFSEAQSQRYNQREIQLRYCRLSSESERSHPNSFRKQDSLTVLQIKTGQFSVCCNTFLIQVSTRSKKS
jgi:hypothetical protein